MGLRRGSRSNAFWNNAATGANGNSNVVEFSSSVESLAINVTVSGATTISVQVAPRSNETTEGIIADTNTAVWHQLYIVADPIQIVFSGAGSASIVLPDWVHQYVRLNSSNNVTATAGWESSSN